MIIINSFKSVIRSKGRTILIVSLVFVISLATTISLSILKASTDARNSGNDIENISATIEMDRSQMMQGGGGPDAIRDQITNIPSLDTQTLLKYGESDLVKEVYTSTTFTLDGSSVEPFSEQSTSSTNNQSFGGMGGGPMGAFESGDFTVSAISTLSALKDFNDGSKSLVEGVFFDTSSSQYEIVVNQDLMSFNDLKLGDSITLSNPKNDGNVFEFKIVGVYKSESTTSNLPQFGNASDGANLIYMSEITSELIAETSRESSIMVEDFRGESVSSELNLSPVVTYIIENPEKYELFRTYLSESGLSESYTLSSADLNSYESRLAPYDNIVSFAKTLLWIILGVGSVVLCVIHSFNINQRKFEVGVLTAIGLQKWKVANQFVVEILMVTMMGILLGCGVGALVSVPVSNKLMESQVTNTFNTNQFGPNGQMQGRPSFDAGFENLFGNGQEMIATINASVDFSVVVKMMAVGLVITVISSLGSIVFILRYEPLEILAERS